MWSQLNQRPTQPLLICMCVLLAPVPKPIATSGKITEVNGFWFYPRTAASTEHVHSGMHRTSLHEFPHKQQLAENRIQHRFSLVPTLTICWTSFWLNGFFSSSISSVPAAAHGKPAWIQPSHTPFSTQWIEMKHLKFSCMNQRIISITYQ